MSSELGHYPISPPFRPVLCCRSPSSVCVFLTDSKAQRKPLNELPVSTFQEAIQATHGCGSALRYRVEVREEWEHQTVWEGDVLVFDLIDHPTALSCYAWSVDNEVTAVLNLWPVDSPEKAVRASIVESFRSQD